MKLDGGIIIITPKPGNSQSNQPKNSTPERLSNLFWSLSTRFSRIP